MWSRAQLCCTMYSIDTMVPLYDQLVGLLKLVNFTVFYLTPLYIGYSVIQAILANIFN